MARIKPFKAIRPTQDKVASVTSRSYETYNAAEVSSVLQHNPFSFLHILSSGFAPENPWVTTTPLRAVRSKYQEFLSEHILQRDEEACFYLYQTTQANSKSLGLFCACSVEDYQKGVIKKHEHTLQQRETLLTDYLQTLGCNVEPVLLTYPDEALIATLLQKETLRPPEYDFTTADEVQHTLWKLDAPQTIAQLQSVFAAMDALYIADGHHRCASSQRLAEKRKAENPAHTGQETYNFFMAYLVPESQITIHGFNRMVKDLNGFSANAFLRRLAEHFKIVQRQGPLFEPAKRHHFTMYVAGAVYSLRLRSSPYVFTHALSTLCPEILYKTILEPVLGISDPQYDKRMAYESSQHPLTHIKERVDSGEFAVGFSLAPLTIKEIKAVADADLVMPPKSTYIEPKLRSGLLVYEL